VCFPGVQDEGTELTPSQLAVTLGVGAVLLLVAQECNVSVVLPLLQLRVSFKLELV
jgi:hypothetical protein